LRRFVDLHLRPPFQDVGATERMASMAAEMGYSLVGLTFDTSVSREATLTTTKFFKDQGLETVTRIDLHPKNRNELLTSLRKARSSFDIVSVECDAKQVTPLAFRDRRVDLVFFSPSRRKLRVSELTPARAKRTVEFNIADLLNNDFVCSNLRKLLSVIWNTKRKHLPFVISSGATDCLLMRAPKDMAAVLSILGLDATHALDAVSSIPLSLAQKSLEKRGLRFVSNGVETVRSRA